MSSTPYNYQKTVNGTVQVTQPGMNYTSNHQIHIEGSAANYIIKFRPPGATVFKDITSGTLNGATGTPLLVECRAAAFEITPPDGADYNLVINGLDV